MTCSANQFMKPDMRNPMKVVESRCSYFYFIIWTFWAWLGKSSSDGNMTNCLKFLLVDLYTLVYKVQPYVHTGLWDVTTFTAFSNRKVLEIPVAAIRRSQFVHVGSDEYGGEVWARDVNTNHSAGSDGSQCIGISSSLAHAFLGSLALYDSFEEEIRRFESQGIWQSTCVLSVYSARLAPPKNLD